MPAALLQSGFKKHAERETPHSFMYDRQMQPCARALRGGGLRGLHDTEMHVDNAPFERRRGGCENDIII
jgi:hypothetical protein